MFQLIGQICPQRCHFERKKFGSNAGLEAEKAEVRLHALTPDLFMSAAKELKMMS